MDRIRTLRVSLSGTFLREKEGCRKPVLGVCRIRLSLSRPAFTLGNGVRHGVAFRPHAVTVRTFRNAEARDLHFHKAPELGQELGINMNEGCVYCRRFTTYE